MKRLTALTAILCIHLILPGQAAPPDTILLFHPTRSNLITFTDLLESDILKLEGFHFKGVYHIDESYDYSASYEYLSMHPSLPFSLFEVSQDLSPSVLFSKNECSKIFSQLFSHSTGAIFLGGPDIPPLLYGESKHLLTKVTDPGRHFLEISFLFHLLGGYHDPAHEPLMAVYPNYGVLGICLGMQSINVATGGTMVQDIPMEIYGWSTIDEIMNSSPDNVHRNYAEGNMLECVELTSYHFHPISIRQELRVHQRLAENDHPPFVLSSHHQAIEKTGKGLIVLASSEDGKVIEMIGHSDFKNLLGVQFHPEKTGLYHSNEISYITSDSTISYKDYSLKTGSYAFHLTFWEVASELFK